MNDSLGQSDSGKTNSLRILVVTHSFPPVNVISTYRMIHWIKYWLRDGHSVTVLTTKKYGFEGVLDLPVRSQVRLTVHEVEYFPRVIGEFLRKRKTDAATQPTGESKSGIGKRFIATIFRVGVSTMRWLTGSFFHPTAFWILPGRRRLAEILRNESFDAILSTYGPYSAHLIAQKAVQSEPQLTWVVDYRDLWSGNPAASMFFGAEWFERLIEKHAISGAGCAIHVSDDNQRFFSRRFKKPSIVVQNGFDPEEYTALSESEQPDEFCASVTNVVYAGRIYSGRRDPTILFEAIAKHNLQQQVAVHFFGTTLGSIQQLIDRFGLEDVVRVHGYRSRDRMLQILAHADALLLLESGDISSRGVLTGKLFEYLAVSRPILALGIRKTFESAQIILDCKAGIVPEDDDELISRFLVNPSQYYIGSEEVSAFRRDVQARRVLSLFHDESRESELTGSERQGS